MLFSNNPFIKDTFRIIGEIIIITSSVTSHDINSETFGIKTNGKSQNLCFSAKHVISK